MLKDKLVKLRNEKGLSQSKLAEMLNITRQAYNHYETGTRTPPTDTLTILSDIYDVSTDFLLGREEQNKKISSPSKEDELINVIVNLNLSPDDLQRLAEVLKTADITEQRLRLIEMVSGLNANQLKVFEKLLAAAEAIE